MENNFDENFDNVDPEKEMEIENNMRKKINIPVICFDFSCYFSDQTSKQPSGKVINAVIKILEEIDEINEEALFNSFGTQCALIYFEKGSPKRERFRLLLKQANVLLQYFNIKYIPGYQVYFKANCIYNNEIVQRIEKDGKFIMSATVKNNYDSVENYKKNYYKNED